ncbi:MAG: amidohydrolase, partial [Bacteroidota bacterium]
MLRRFSLLFVLTLLGTCARAQVAKAPDRGDFGDGPYPQLILRGLTLINGNCAPPIGPVDIVIEGNRIVSTSSVGVPGEPINERRRPKLKEGGKEYDCTGMYVLPGFVDMHGHIGGRAQGADADYVFKLWLGHGITTIREPGSFNGLEWVLEHKKRSEANEIAAPRIIAYTGFGQGRMEPFTTEAEVEQWVRDNKAKGADGIKFFGERPEFME